MGARHLPIAGALVASMLLATPASGRELTWVGIGGPRDWAPRPGYTLEIGSDAWTINAIHGGGVTALPLTQPTVVRVRRLSDCAPVVRFVAQRGRNYFIRFAADGAARVEDWTGEGMDSGPALGDPGAPVCPRLPDTSTAPPPPRDSVNPALVIASGTLAVGGMLLLTGRRRRPAPGPRPSAPGPRPRPRPRPADGRDSPWSQGAGRAARAGSRSRDSRPEPRSGDARLTHS